MKELKCAIAAIEAGLDKQELIKLSKIAKEPSKLGGKTLMQYYGNLNNIKNKSRVGDLVTDADLACERIVVDLLIKKSPEISILAEETGLSGDEENLCWCLDPLDGTTNFVHNLPIFSVLKLECFLGLRNFIDFKVILILVILVGVILFFNNFFVSLL